MARELRKCRTCKTEVSKMKAGRFKRLKIVAAAVGLLVALIYLNNTSLLVEPIGTRPFLVAHRALGQGFGLDGLTGKTCTASRMLPPEHGYLENTIAAMETAFDYGADVVEFDVHSTVDDRFAVFHDWTVDCRTEGSGVTREHTLEELQKLDIGYGYTSDGGKTWPFRGKGVGMMPSLEQVMATFPDRNFVIDVKSNDTDEGRLLAERLAALSVGREGQIAVTGGPRPVGVIRERLPLVRSITRPQLKRCLMRYIAIGWTGFVPSECGGSLLTVPANVAPWLWGWPNRLLRRMDKVGTRVVLIGDYGGEGFSLGFDDPDRLTELPAGYSGGIWTNRIDLIGPAVRAP
jgi:glycerophosphoryl diester phosphodiesterase